MLLSRTVGEYCLHYSSYGEVAVSDQRANEQDHPIYEPPRLMRHGKLAEVTQTTPPDALDSTMRPGERRHRPEETGQRD